MMHEIELGLTDDEADFHRDIATDGPLEEQELEDRAVAALVNALIDVVAEMSASANSRYHPTTRQVAARVVLELDEMIKNLTGPPMVFQVDEDVQQRVVDILLSNGVRRKRLNAILEDFIEQGIISKQEDTSKHEHHELKSYADLLPPRLPKYVSADLTSNFRGHG